MMAGRSGLHCPAEADNGCQVSGDRDGRLRQVWAPTVGGPAVAAHEQAAPRDRARGRWCAGCCQLLAWREERWMGDDAGEVTADDYRRLAEFRYRIRRFLAFSAAAAR